jgi:wyosine [tRNA(Phe)-imidazoG37] synthetase (radical SAM superfamily)
MTAIHHDIAYGPVRSRRLGLSLGINLLPADGKVCSFNCIYCECGLNEERRTHSPLPQRTDVVAALERKLSALSAEGIALDVITFAGNGEPTLHPDFSTIIDDTVTLRNRLAPSARIAVLSNATMLHLPQVADALLRIDDCILKLDSVLDRRIRQLNAPASPSFSFDTLLPQLAAFSGKAVIQTMFLKGTYRGESVTNTTEEEIKGWLEALARIHPRLVMIYTLARDTPVAGLQKLLPAEMEAIAERVRAAGLRVSVA